MRRTIIIIISLLFFSYAKAQLFTGGGGAINNLGQDTFFNISVSGLNPAQLNSAFGIEQVGININHPAIEELTIYLRSPSGNIIQLIIGSSCHGINYTNTYFNSQANTSITSGTAPFSGTYKPIGYLGRFNTGQTANGIWQLIVHDGFAFVNPGNVVSWSIQFGNLPSPSVVLASSNLPIVVINTNGQPISDSKILVSMGIIDNGSNRNYVTDPFNNYNAKAMISLHGHSTRNFEKKAYNFETRDASGIQFNTSLLGMPPENDWDLIAMFQDKSLLRIPLAYDLSRKMGHYAARFKNVEVILNNEYRGVYALMEKIKRDTNRIYVSKLESPDNALPNITGGYIIKIDRSDVPGWSSLLPGDSPSNSHFYYQYIYPKDSDITAPQKVYIKDFIDGFETVMNSSSFADPNIGYPKYIDMSSLIDFFIINELSKNVDAYRLSTFMYKDNITKGGKLHFGPVWDYDLAWHNCNYGNSFIQTEWQYTIQDSVYPNPTWWKRFMQDTNFVNALYCRWNKLRQGILSVNNLWNYIDSSANELNESQQRNFTQWPILGAYIRPNPQSQLNADYQSEVADLKNWLASRIGWMDWAITGNCSYLSIEENSIDNNLVVYPNPFHSSTTFAFSIKEDAYVSLKIIDVMGKEIALLLNEHKHPGDFKINFDRGQTVAGIYFYQLKINKTIKTGKIIIE